MAGAVEASIWPPAGVPMASVATSEGLPLQGAFALRGHPMIFEIVVGGGYEKDDVTQVEFITRPADPERSLLLDGNYGGNSRKQS